MDVLQNDVLRKTDELLFPTNIFTIVINSLFSGAILTLFLTLFNLEVNVLNVSLVFIVSILWVTLRYFYSKSKDRKRLLNQHNYLFEKRPYAGLKVPIFGKYGSKLSIKNASLYFVGDELIMEAFRKDERGKEIIGSKSIKQGNDFVLYDYEEDIKQRYVTYKAKLMGADYSFSVVNIPEVLNMINKSKGALKQ